LSFALVESYFKDRLKEVEPKFKEHEDAFTTDNIGASQFNYAYHIAFGPMRCGPLRDLITTDIMSIDITLYLNGKQDTRSRMLQAYDVANNFRLNAIAPKNAMSGAMIKNVNGTNIKSEGEKGNDSAIKMTCSFDVTLNFSPNYS
jgi:hypothetical protein